MNGWDLSQVNIAELAIVLLAVTGIVMHAIGWHEARQDVGAALMAVRNKPTGGVVLRVAWSHVRSEGIRFAAKVLALVYGLIAMSTLDGPLTRYDTPGLAASACIIIMLVLLNIETLWQRSDRRKMIRESTRAGRFGKGDR